MASQIITSVGVSGQLFCGSKFAELKVNTPFSTLPAKLADRIQEIDGIEVTEIIKTGGRRSSIFMEYNLTNDELHHVIYDAICHV